MKTTEHFTLIKLLVICLMPCMAFLTSQIPPTLALATSNPGPITPASSIPIDETTTQKCPDGTEISIVMECPNPPGLTECPPNQLVIITHAGDCVGVPAPFTCPDGVLAPTAEQCSTPLIATPLPTTTALATETLQTPTVVEEPEPARVTVPFTPAVPAESPSISEEDSSGSGDDDDEDSEDEDDDDEGED